MSRDALLAVLRLGAESELACPACGGRTWHCAHVGDRRDRQGLYAWYCRCGFSFWTRMHQEPYWSGHHDGYTLDRTALDHFVPGDPTA